ncbi:MAG TPA: abscisic acid-deficient protein Aba4 family protein [Propionibacteriaceae bacterium]|nr:abscisic acid-deficient protein Aba4 family protein [Propionibacteriaceae bacterium]
MEPSSPDALHPGESSDSQAFYRSQVTVGLSSWQPVPRFARLTAVLVGVFQKTPGAVKLTFSVAPGRRQFTSHSVWRDSAAAQEFFKSPEHREAMKRAYAGMTDEFYVIHTGGEPFYSQRCPRCHAWTKGSAPSSHCSKCQAALPHHLHPVAQKAEAPGPEYGTISPDMTPESNLKILELATALSAPLSTEHAAQVYRMVNLIPVLWWLPMILAPSWRGTRAMTTSRGLLAGLGLFYGAFLLKAITEEGPPNYATYEEGPRRLFASHAGLLAGWAHYLAFDLFVGVWIYRTGLAEKRTTRLPLLLTFVAGPLGLLYFLLQRGLRRPMPYPFDRPKTKKGSGRFLPQKNQ